MMINFNQKDDNDDAKNLGQLKMLNLRSQSSQRPTSILNNMNKVSQIDDTMKNESHIVADQIENKEDGEQKVTINSHLKKTRQTFPLKEILIFSGFTVIMIYIISAQLNIEKSFLLNKYLKYNFAKNFTTGDKLQKQEINQYLERSVIREFYSTETFHDYDLKSEMRHISFLRIRQKRANIVNQTIGNNTVYTWESPISLDTSDFGLSGEFKYDSSNDGFVQFFSPFNLTAKEAKSQFAALQNAKFFDQQTKYISVDGVFFNGNYDMISVFQIEFDFSSAGSSSVTVNTESFRIQPYSTTQDTVRMIFEIIFLVLFIFYVLDEFLKIYKQISKVQGEYDEKQKYKEDLKERTKGLMGRQNKNQPLSFEKALDTIKQFSRIINILKGLGNHVQDVWSFLDVAMLTFTGLAINFWLRFALNDRFTNLLKEIPDLNNITERNNYDYTDCNSEAIFLGDYLVNFRIYACLSVFIAAFKTTKYLISLFSRLSDFLQIMMRMLDFMLFYLILLTSIIFAFAYMGIFIYGSHISVYSSLYKSIVQTIILMISGSSVSQEMIEFNLIGTLFYFLVFYFLTISILVNMFWVFVKNEYLTFESEKEQIMKTINIAANNTQEIETHIYYYFKTQLQDIWLRLKYSTNQQKYHQYQQDKSIKEKRIQREFEYSQSQVKFDLDFADVLEQGQAKSLSFQVEEEREKHIQGLKMETIRIIWQTVFLLLFLVINIQILFLFDNPTNSHKQYLNQYKNIINSNTTISYSDDTQGTFKFLEMEQKDQVFNWLSKEIVNQFVQIDMTSKQDYLFPGGATEYPELGTNPLIGYYIDFFNLLMFNKVRLTLKYAPLTSSSQFSNIEPYIFSHLVAYNQDTYIFEEAPITVSDNIDFSTSASDGIKYTKGYTFGVSPSDFEDLFGRLKREGELKRELVTICIDYAIFNPQGPQKGLTYNQLIFEFGENGMLKKNEILSESIVILKLNEAPSIVLLILIILLAFYLIYNLYQLIQNLRGKYRSYQRWYELYILNYLSPGQLYYRERQKPEIIRKMQYIFNIPIILRFLYTLLISLIVIAFLYLIFQSQFLANNGQVFNISTQHFLSFTFKQFDEKMTFFQYINRHADLIQTFKIVKPISALSVFILCVQILYNLTTNQAFQDILKAIKYVVSQLPSLIILLWMLITSFGLLTFFKLGSYEQEFSTFSKTYIILCECFYQLKTLLHIFQKDGSWFEVFIFLIPYIIVVRFLMLNLFSAVVYKGYETIFQQRKQREKDDMNQIDPLAIGFKEFFTMSWRFFNEKKEEERAKNTEFINQIVKKSSMFEIFDQIKTTVRQYKPQMDPAVWADRCASDLKKEFDIRSSLKQICDELSLSYMKSLNQGNFSFINELNKDQKRKLAEFKLRLKYYTYFKLGYNSYKQIQYQFENHLQFFKSKFSTIFNQQTESEIQEYYLKLYICQLEEKMKQRQQIVYQIKSDISYVTGQVQKQQQTTNDYN